MNECLGLMGKIFGHNLEAIYNKESKFIGDTNAVVTLFTTRFVGIENILAQMSDHKKMYVQHVCKRCGKVIKEE